MNEFPLHWCVFEDDLEQLKGNLLKVSKAGIEQKDLRGKTPLELAVFMSNTRCAKLLVEHGADCGLITKTGWNLVQESVSSGNAELVKLIYSYRDYQREASRSNGIPELLNKLKQASDFYVEMKWEFTSWIPLISKACPSDVYKIYKSGSNVRIDTTLIGFDGSSWERGNRSYIFQANNRGTATIIEIDHIQRTYHIDKLTATVDQSESSTDVSDQVYEPDDFVVQTKLTNPNIVTFLDIDKIEFERNRSGMWGWRSDKNELINGFDCKVFSANNLQLVTKTRVEHLEGERARAFIREIKDSDVSAGAGGGQNSGAFNGSVPSFVSNFFQGNEQHVKIDKKEKKLTSLEYFQKQVAIDYYMNGTMRAIDETQKIQTFNANLSLSDSYPLSLHEQVLPIVDLMALNNSHFKKLKEFITLQLPSGFPVKIEIPLYRVITAKVTFGNIHATDQPIKHVNTLTTQSLNTSTNYPPPHTAETSDESSDFESSNTAQDDTKFLLSQDIQQKKPSKLTAQPSSSINNTSTNTCVVEESVFQIPVGYKCTNRDYSTSMQTSPSSQTASASNFRYNHPRPPIDDDDIMLQIAIQQSLAAAAKQDENEAPIVQGENNALPNLELSGIVGAILPVRDSSGSTQSLREYQERQSQLGHSQREDDILLQRALEESLMTASNAGSNDFVAPAPDLGVESSRVASGSSVTDSDDAVLKALIDLSRREAEERASRIKEEEDEWQKILALSLIDK